MGAGRNSHFLARYLSKKDLGAVIFGCTHNTINECLRQQLFGLPASHISYVQNIEPGLPLFLFNYGNRKLHGIFEAAGKGELGINIYAWTADGSKKTQYPAQVHVHIRKQCKPLAEEQYRQILADNYYGQGHHFWFELDHAQTAALLLLFENFPVYTAPTYAPIQRTTHRAFNNVNRRHEVSDKELIGREEKCVYERLEYIALNKGSLHTSAENDRREAAVPSMVTKTCSGNASANSSGFLSEINQLRQEMNELKAFSMEKERKISALEIEMASSHVEFQQLRHRVVSLENQLKSSSRVCDDEMSGHQLEAQTAKKDKGKGKAVQEEEDQVDVDVRV